MCQYDRNTLIGKKRSTNAMKRNRSFVSSFSNMRVYCFCPVYLTFEMTFSGNLD